MSCKKRGATLMSFSFSSALAQILSIALIVLVGYLFYKVIKLLNKKN